MTLITSGPMQAIEIPSDMILDAMIKKMGLPCPEYKTGPIEEGYFQTTLVFYPSFYFLQASLPPHSVVGCMATTLQEAKSYAATNAIRYMSTDQRKVVKDSNYDELQEQIKKQSS